MNGNCIVDMKQNLARAQCREQNKLASRSDKGALIVNKLKF